jgi:integrase
MASHLGQFLIQGSTYNDYFLSLNQFYEWVSRKGYGSIKGAKKLDKFLSKYFHYLYFKGYGVSRASSLFCSILFFYPQYRSSLPISYQAWRGWKKMEPSRHKPALSMELVVLIAAVLARDYDFRLALIVLLSFDCYLRPKEAISLQCNDLFIIRRSVADGVSSSRLAIRIKRGKRDSNATIYINNPAISDLISFFFRSHHLSLASSEKFLGISYSFYLSSFNSVISSLGLSDSVRPHCMRHSGATHDFLHGVEFARIRERGRWATDKTLRSYLNISLALLNDLRVPSPLLRTGSLILSSLREFFLHFIR